MEFKKGDKVNIEHGGGILTTTITGSFKERGRTYYTLKATGKDRAFPASRLWPWEPPYHAIPFRKEGNKPRVQISKVPTQTAANFTDIRVKAGKMLERPNVNLVEIREVGRKGGMHLLRVVGSSPSKRSKARGGRLVTTSGRLVRQKRGSII